MRLLPAATRVDSSQALRIAAQVVRQADERHWDSMAETYLALVALHNAHVARQPRGGNPRDAAIDQALAELRARLRFPASVDPTTGRTSERFNSPRDYQPAEVRESLEKLQELLAR